MTKKEEKERFIKGCDFTIIYKTEECYFCSYDGTESYDVSEKEAYDMAFVKGWRIVISEKYGAIALACPDCAKKKDKNR